MTTTDDEINGYSAEKIRLFLSAAMLVQAQMTTLQPTPIILSNGRRLWVSTQKQGYFFSY